MRRGDLVVVTVSGDFGKPRPALIVQSDQFDVTGSVTVLLLSSQLNTSLIFRITVQSTAENGLRSASQIMVDKAMSIKRSKIGQTIGRIDRETMIVVERALGLFLGIA